MGLYIPDLRLPDDGDFELWIAVRKDGSFTYNVRGGWQDGKQKAVPVPPHGDLIDRGPFIEFIKTHWDSYDQWFVEQLEARPTIIPVEEGET